LGCDRSAPGISGDAEAGSTFRKNAHSARRWNLFVM
jgi:hypothetical protein